LQSETEKAISGMRNKKATGDEDLPGNVLKLLGEGGLKIMALLFNTFLDISRSVHHSSINIHLFPLDTQYIVSLIFYIKSSTFFRLIRPSSGGF
jgi:hypothetical protein